MRRTALILTLLALLAGAAPAAGSSNGQLAASELAHVVTPKGCTRLAKPAAAAWNSMALYAGHAQHASLAFNGCASTYRPTGHAGDYPSHYGTQFYFRGYWCALGHCENAAPPGTSNHGWGLAGDVNPATRSYIDAHGRAFGWCKCWSDAPQESWHIKWNAAAGFHRPNPGTSLTSPRLELGSGGAGQAAFVRIVQRDLRRHHHPQRVDGAFGSHTRAGVIRLQRNHHLPAHGVVGARTWRVLRH